MNKLPVNKLSDEGEMRLRTIITTRTLCGECGQELRDALDFTLHHRQHYLEQVASTPDGRRILETLEGMGFKNEPDPWNRRGR